VYQTKDIAQVTRRQRLVWLWMLVITAVMLGGYVYLLLIRQFWPSFIVFTLLVFIIIFIIQEHLLPLKHYKALLTRAVEGQGLTFTATCIGFGEHTVDRFGQRFHELFCYEEDPETPRKVYLESRFVPQAEMNARYEFRCVDHFILDMSPVKA
jgi:hypothetical protein